MARKTGKASRRNAYKRVVAGVHLQNKYGIIEKRTIEVDEYMAEIVKYKEAEEQKHPGKPWDGNIPYKYSVTLEDGTEACVGEWVYMRKMARRNRLAKGIVEKSLAEERLDDVV